MPRPHSTTATEAELLRKIDTLSTKLLEVNAELRLKTIYAQRLEVLLHQRCNRIDALFAQLERANTINRRLEQQCKQLDVENTCLTTLIAASLDNIPKLIAS